MTVHVIDLNKHKEELVEMIATGNQRSLEIIGANEEVADKAKEILGHNGRMMYGSKSRYCDKYPKNYPVFNANVVFKRGKVWYGDLDLTLDEEKLVQLAKETGQTIYVLREMDARFENEENPLLDRAVYAVSPDGKASFEEEYYRRATHGKLKGKIVQKAIK